MSEHEDRIRRYLRGDIELAESDYPVLVAAPSIDKEFSANVILGPFSERICGNSSWSIVLQGLLFSVILEENFTDVSIDACILKKEGSLLVSKGDIMEYSCLREILLQSRIGKQKP